MPGRRVCAARRSSISSGRKWFGDMANLGRGAGITNSQTCETEGQSMQRIKTVSSHPPGVRSKVEENGTRLTLPVPPQKWKIASPTVPCTTPKKKRPRKRNKPHRKRGKGLKKWKPPATNTGIKKSVHRGKKWRGGRKRKKDMNKPKQSFHPWSDKTNINTLVGVPVAGAHQESAIKTGLTGHNGTTHNTTFPMLKAPRWWER